VIGLGVLYAVLSGVANGLFSAPMKIIPVWKWENIWLIFILTACLLMPAAVVLPAVNPAFILAAAPGPAVNAALAFGFAWGFGAILFGLSVHTLGVSLANSLVIGLSSALGSVVPLIIAGGFRAEARVFVLFAGVATFLAGVWLCGRAGRMREQQRAPEWRGYFFAIGSGVMSAVFNIGYTLALPMADAGERLGLTRFTATNVIWLLMLGAGALPNIAFCGALLARHGSARLFGAAAPPKSWGLSVLMGLLWGGSIFLYGAATPLLGDIGPAIGWPLSLAVGLLVANLMGYLLGEWRKATAAAIRSMQLGIAVLLIAILITAASTALS
jgi:L-rhamnose-H+ transport protein